jgi:phosphate-selective porin OprO/OprP
MTHRCRVSLLCALTCALSACGSRALIAKSPAAAPSYPTTAARSHPPLSLPTTEEMPIGLTRRLPPVDQAVEPVHFQDPADSAAPTFEERFSSMEKEWKEFQERQKPTGYIPPGKPTLQINGQVQADYVAFGQDPVSVASVGDLQDAGDFRRTRIGAQGKAFEVYYYQFGVDFSLAPNPSLLDNYIEHRELPLLQRARIGHYFEPFSLERVTQNRSNTFMERSLVDTFAPARNLGAMTYGFNEAERVTWQIGTFRTNSDNQGNDSFDSGQALTMRSTCLPYWDEPSDGSYYVHVGAAYSYRDTLRDQVRFRNSPEIRVQQPDGTSNFSPIFVDTGNIPASNFQLFDGEFAWIRGPFSVQSEYACSQVTQIGGPNLFFSAVMVQLSYFLTGEHRPYDRHMGIHRVIVPYSEFFLVRGRRGAIRGRGAWELAFRYSKIDLTDENILGNDLQDFTVGLNWYWNGYARTRFNYIRAFLDDPTVGRSVTNIYGVRIDFEF